LVCQPHSLLTRTRVARLDDRTLDQLQMMTAEARPARYARYARTIERDRIDPVRFAVQRERQQSPRDLAADGLRQARIAQRSLHHAERTAETEPQPLGIAETDHGLIRNRGSRARVLDPRRERR